jgi:DNA-binding NtrC family response regulator
MSLPRVLVIDDQYARDPGTRSGFLRQVGGVAPGDSPSREVKSVAEIHFSSGQRLEAGRLINDLGVARSAAAQEDWSLVLLDLRFDSGPLGPDGAPTGDSGDAAFGEQIRRCLIAEFPACPVVMLSSSHQQELPDREVAYLSKEGLNPNRLRSKLLEVGRLTRDQSAVLLKLPSGVIAESEAMRRVFRDALVFAERDAPVLLLGATGTGKEVLARYVHENSRRASGPFVPFDLGAIAPGLVEAHIFGHEKGAFTGAKDTKLACFELAKGGTLFLDEIGELSHEVQAKLLRALESQRFRRLGGSEEITIDARLVSATSRSLDVFRVDFLERIRVLDIEVPPLDASRKKDIVPLAQMFLEKLMEAAGSKGIVLSPEAEAALENHPFRGNVRELRNTLTRLVALADNNAWISARDVATVLKSQALETSAAPRLSIEPLENRSSQSSAPPLGGPSVGLASLHSLLNAIRVDQADPGIEGLMPRLGEAFGDLRRRLAAAALARCRDPVTGSLNRQAAMQYLTGDRSLRGQGPRRLLNEILGKAQGSELSDEELEDLIQECSRDDGSLDVGSRSPSSSKNL